MSDFAHCKICVCTCSTNSVHRIATVLYKTFPTLFSNKLTPHHSNFLLLWYFDIIVLIIQIQVTPPVVEISSIVFWGYCARWKAVAWWFVACMVVPSLMILVLKPLSSCLRKKTSELWRKMRDSARTSWIIFCNALAHIMIVLLIHLYHFSEVWCRGIHFLDELTIIIGEEASEDTSGLETKPGIRRETLRKKARICDATASFNK